MAHGDISFIYLIDADVQRFARCWSILKFSSSGNKNASSLRLFLMAWRTYTMQTCYLQSPYFWLLCLWIFIWILLTTDRLSGIPLFLSHVFFYFTVDEVVWRRHSWDDILSYREWGLPHPCWRSCGQGIRPWYCFCTGDGISSIQVSISDSVKFYYGRGLNTYLLQLGSGEESFSGPILLGPHTFAQNWRIGQWHMEISSSRVLI